MQDIMQVCLNGHKINTSYNRYPERNRKFCNTCGAKTITKCPECNSSIKGKKYTQGVVSTYSPPVKEFCDNCGKPYPWAKTKKEITEFDKKGIDIIFDKFHKVAKHLLYRHNERDTLEITDEYDVQDLLNALLIQFYDDVRPEEWNPSYAGGSTRNDFLLKNEEIVIEVKKTNKRLKDKQIGEQLIIDIAKYQTHPNCKELYCFVYDPDEYIKNPKGLISDLEKLSNNIKVNVIIKPER